jgi:hypothetical protein
MPPAEGFVAIQSQNLERVDLCGKDFCLLLAINPEYEGEINSRRAR